MKGIIISIIFIILCTISTSLNAQDRDYNRYRGGEISLEAGGFISTDKFEMNGYTPLGIIAGYSFNKHLFIGGGVQFNIHPNYKTVTLPFFGRIRVAILKSKVSPYLQADIGFILPVVPLLGSKTYLEPTGTPPNPHGTHHFKFYCTPEIGLLVRLKNLKSFHFGIGYTEQAGEFTLSSKKDGDTIHTKAGAARAITIKAGFTF